MPQDESAAAPAPVTPRTVRNRLRSMESVISVMTHAAIAGDIVLDVTAHTPTHAQRRDLFHLGRFLHVAMAGDAGGGPERLDVSHVREAHEAGQRVDANPIGRFP